jgi:anthranilate phosphoribosyltransferase
MRSIQETMQALGRDGEGALSEEDAAFLAGAMLDGGVPDLELGCLLALLRMRTDQAGLLAGMLDALDRRMNRWVLRSEKSLPVVIGCHGGAREVPSLVPLLALLLAKYDVPVLLHGALHAASGVSSALVLRELGILPCTQRNQIDRDLAERRIAFAPTALIAPGLANLLALQPRVGPMPLLVAASRLLMPLDAGGLIVAGAQDTTDMDAMRQAVGLRGSRALLLEGTEGEAFASPLRRPAMEYWCQGDPALLFEQDRSPPRRPGTLPHCAPAETAGWIRQVVSGGQAVPSPLINQLAACLFASGYCEDFNQAKAVAAVGAVGRRVA